MARIRTVKPEFWDDEIIGTLSREARLLFIASWNLSDDSGRLRWSPAYLKAGAFIYDEDISQELVSQFMAELVDSGLIVPYESGRGKQQFAFIVNFLKHQKISHPTASRLPDPPNVPRGTLQNDSRENRSESENIPQDMEGNGRDVEGNGDGKEVSCAPTDLQVSQIGHEHPKNRHLKGQFLPNRQEFAIAEAIKRHSYKVVMDGTIACRQAFDSRPREDLCFAPDPFRFYSESEYLKDPVVWQKQLSKSDVQEERRLAEANIGVFRPI